ncbi:MAG: Arm DNA-binding domain-containing protein [Candidatus Binataceae bacterium]
MPRRRKTRRRACSVQTTSQGFLRFRFRWKLPSGQRRMFCEATALRDSPDNRASVERQAELIGAEIRSDTFNYLKWFPNGNRWADFLATEPRMDGISIHNPIANGCTVRSYYGAWIKRKTPPDVRASLERDYKNHFTNYILDELGEVPLGDLSLAHLEDLKNSLRRRGLSIKTIRNAIDGSFRAMVRDAASDGIPAAFPFPKLSWPEKIVPGPSPFTTEERDKLLGHFRTKRWKVGGFNDTRPHYHYYAYLYTLFFTGMRPSEVAAVRLRSVNLRAGALQVERSRHLGAEAAPKTKGSRRIVRLTASHITALQPLVELKARPDDYLFKNVRGEPIEPANFYDLFLDAQRALMISPLRDLYSTKDTYVSLALTNGVNLKWLSEQTGVAGATLHQHYGKFVHTTEADALELEKIDGATRPERPNQGQFVHRFVHRSLPETQDPDVYSGFMASPTGFEPVLPT